MCCKRNIAAWFLTPNGPMIGRLNCFCLVTRYQTPKTKDTKQQLLSVLTRKVRETWEILKRNLSQNDDRTDEKKLNCMEARTDEHYDSLSSWRSKKHTHHTLGWAFPAHTRILSPVVEYSRWFRMWDSQGFTFLKLLRLGSIPKLNWRSHHVSIKEVKWFSMKCGHSEWFSIQRTYWIDLEGFFNLIHNNF